MFNKEKTQSERGFASSATLISSGTILTGDIKSDNDLRIDGTIHGNIYSTAKIVIGPSGLVEGNIQAIAADVTGRVTGNISVSEILQLRSDSNVQGNIAAGKLQIDPSAVFNGKCEMRIGEASGRQLMNKMHAETAEVG
jgi:cytoskeletal protein CcmA (bactofilin family)